MSLYDRILDFAAPVVATPESTSYFSTPEPDLDPRLFRADHLKPQVRSAILAALYGFWRSRYHGAESWSTVWLAGSGVSYQWSAAREPGDLDCLIGVDFVDFRRHNPDWRDLSDGEIATYLNKEMHDRLWPRTAHFLGHYEATFYINPGGRDIRDIHPYAAYDVTHDVWTVHPDRAPKQPTIPEFDLVVSQDQETANRIISRYNKALDETMGVLNPGMRLNSEITLRTSMNEAKHLYDQIHEGRKAAFGPGGRGYDDLAEFRYKSAKGGGFLKALRSIVEELDAAQDEDQQAVYGMPLYSSAQAFLDAALAHRRGF